MTAPAGENLGDTAATRLADGEASAFLYLCGSAAAIAVLTLSAPIAFKTWGDFGYIALTIPAGLLALLSAHIAERAPLARTLWLIAALALVLRLVLLLLDPLLSTDIYRYVWDGKVQAAGINPYRFVPADPALASMRDAAIYPNINRADYATTIYPPVAQAFFFVVTRFGENVTVMRLALIGCEAVTVAMIVMLLRRMNKPITRVVAYLWHPLPMWEIANSGHVDALMVALMMAGIVLALSGRLVLRFRSSHHFAAPSHANFGNIRSTSNFMILVRSLNLKFLRWTRGETGRNFKFTAPVRAAIAITLGALAKPIAILALPAIWRPWDWRMPCVVAAAVVICYGPYLSAGTGVLGFLATGYLEEESVTTGDSIWLLAVWRLVFGTTRGDIAVYLIAAAIALGALALAAAHRNPRSTQSILADINRLLLVFLLLLSPNYPWYFLAITPFVALRGGATAWTASIGALLLQEEIDWDTYVPWLARKSIFYGGVLAAFAYSIWSDRRNATGANGPWQQR